VKFKLLFCILVCFVMRGISYAECKIVEYSDQNEVVCEDDKSMQNMRPATTENSKLDFDKEKNFSFYAIDGSGIKITIFGRLSPNAIANPGDTILGYYIHDNVGKYQIHSMHSFKYVSRTGEYTFEISESNDLLDKHVKTTKMFFDNKSPYSLLLPFKSGCETIKENNIYLKMNGFQGAQLNYQIILPKCISTVLGPYIKD